MNNSTVIFIVYICTCLCNDLRWWCYFRSLLKPYKARLISWFSVMSSISHLLLLSDWSYYTVSLFYDDGVINRPSNTLPRLKPQIFTWAIHFFPRPILNWLFKNEFFNLRPLIILLFLFNLFLKTSVKFY